jgi:pimeloyl-ACP methyl ester carboxylesterase
LIEPHFNVEQKNLDGIRQTVATYWTTDLRTRLARHHSDVDAMFSAWSDTWLDPRFTTFDITHETSSIQVPIMIGKREEDPHSTMAQVHIAEARCRCPIETVVIPGVGHSPHRSNSNETLEASASFFRQKYP